MAGKKSQNKNTKRGAPTKYDPEAHPSYARALAIEGLTLEEIAEKLGVTVPTLWEWRKKHSEFFNAIKEGKEQADANVEMSLYKRALGYSYTERKVIDLSDGGTRIETVVKEVVPDVGAQCMWLKNRRPDKWRDKHEIEHSGNIQIIIDKDDAGL
jgi:transcriptional regulator with XRE-family HTH domain